MYIIFTTLDFTSSKPNSPTASKRFYTFVRRTDQQAIALRAEDLSARSVGADGVHVPIPLFCTIYANGIFFSLTRSVEATRSARVHPRRIQRCQLVLFCTRRSAGGTIPTRIVFRRSVTKRTLFLFGNNDRFIGIFISKSMGIAHDAKINKMRRSCQSFFIFLFGPLTLFLI